MSDNDLVNSLHPFPNIGNYVIAALAIGVCVTVVLLAIRSYLRGRRF
ncbi:MAG: hypothetical protein K2W95_29920 [Candidatus Obscuribacterales bacterium]|nr:hypothetical protein [Candidatus Obscuribacterales bacterium]